MKLFKRREVRYRLVMPDDGWDEREVTFYCEWCERAITWRSAYLNLDALLAMGLTQSDFGRELHNVDHHTYDPDTKTWTA